MYQKLNRKHVTHFMGIKYLSEECSLLLDTLACLRLLLLGAAVVRPSKFSLALIGPYWVSLEWY